MTSNGPSLLVNCSTAHSRAHFYYFIASSGFQNEGFTLDYDLPDETAYGETCATIGLILWNHRLLQFSGERKYADVIERGLYNGFLSGVSLDGASFFYENPLASAGGHHRQGWFDCPCCPTNIARTLASLGGYFYSTGVNDVWVHLFAQGTAKLRDAGRDMSFRQVTKYPWNGDVRLEIGVASPQTFALHLRVPGWCERWTLRINGTPVTDLKPQANGYLAIECEWRTGDVVEYGMDMPIQTVWAHPAVRYLQGRLALQRGPLVYCLEGVDHGGIVLDRIAMDPEQVLNDFGVERQDHLLGGLSVLRGQASVVDESGWEGTLYRHSKPSSKPMDITAIPYYAWENRAPGEMRVWVRAV